jgi:DnaK suppressor protein
MAKTKQPAAKAKTVAPAAGKKPPAVKAAKPAPAQHAKPAPAQHAKPAPVRPAKPAPAAGVRLGAKELDQFREELATMRRRLTGKIVQMRQESLKRDDEVNPEEDGTDAFDRLFALERVGSDQEILYAIDEALRAIDAGTYGVCEGCSGLIEKPRLTALPFAKNCIRCQSELERGRHQHAAPRRVVP